MYTAPVFLWRHWSNVANLGHLMWEELGSIYYTQRRFRDVSREIQILHEETVPSERTFRRFIDTVVPAISDKPIRPLRSVVRGRPITCFPKLFVGGAIPFFELPKEPLVEGREEYLMDFRDLLLKTVQVVPFLPSKPVILITHKTHSVYALKSKRHRIISNAVPLRSFIADSFPEAD
eukprot:EG_transcript_21593